MGLGKALRAVREEQGLTQDQLASTTGIYQSTLSRWERDERLPDLTELRQVEQALGVPAGHILLRAGLVDEVTSVEQAIAGDARLTDEGKTYVLTSYRAALNLFSRQGPAAPR
ncbi:MAG: helix-turn-helix domain-containing protein [Acidimicrobiia bacterium]